MVKNILLWVVIAVVLMSVFNSFGPKVTPSAQMSYSQFLQEAKQGRIAQVTIDGRAIQGRTSGGERFTTYSPETDNSAMIGELLTHGVDIEGQPPEKQGLLMQIFISWFPMLLLIGIWVFFLRQMQGGGAGRGAMSFGKSRARMMGEDQIKITFADVAGVDEAKSEVAELVEFLRDPGKFQKLGGKIPRGVLMVGSPGTGKTLLAKAIAGEAKVPFFSISGSDFVEMFVGVGASRVRDMFEQAKKHAPCIIFIDEIDAVGRHRGAGLGGGHDEREQTLNQLLVEMDGFEGNEGIIVIAATNRPDVLDPALLRPGRFDRQVVVPLPDVRGREQILKVHMRKVPLSENVKPSVIARGTPGFSGADLANLVNEAALLATRRQASEVAMEDFTLAIERIVAGLEKKNRLLNPREREIVAYHETGHALAALSLPGSDPVYKISIIPRGIGALGYTMQRPTEDRFLMTKEELEYKIAVLLGGRAAEKLIFNHLSTGASDDIARATHIARSMVTRYGMDPDIGFVVYEDNQERFLGQQGPGGFNGCKISDSTARQIDASVRKIIDDTFAMIYAILESNREVLERCAKVLLEKETLLEKELVNLTADLKRPESYRTGPGR
jgi:cell division protease FtsH